MAFSSPDTHPRISDAEKKFIGLEKAIVHEQQEGKRRNLPPPPFLAFLKSPPFWAVLFAHVGHNWGFYTLLTEIPTYLQNIQHFSLQSVSGIRNQSTAVNNGPLTVLKLEIGFLSAFRMASSPACHTFVCWCPVLHSAGRRIRSLQLANLDGRPSENFFKLSAPTFLPLA